ncbi:alpha-ketoglutarate-dependent dioxygenase AlkB [Hydrocarboniphaga sp.]|uniref:alpha-ketoglutarate-dependent dioxygenase AlkB n=1 Tax=Hydrocarboniphaga sp. TaxID=2033016 RepID=UPI003D111112
MTSDLFTAGPRSLAEDEQGGIVYRPGLLTPAQAQRWFERLRDEIAWGHERRMMYEREVDVPRLMAHFQLDDAQLPPLLKVAAQAVADASGVRYNSLGMNYYRDGRDSVAPHHDKLHELQPGYPIALLSLGATRQMRLSTQAVPRRHLQIDLEPGSLLTMSYASQLQWLHGIPKQPGDQPPRISLAFRVRPR